MKRILCILVCLTIFLPLTGCSSGKKIETGIGETVAWGDDFEIRFDRVSIGNNLYTSPSSKDYYLMPGSTETYVQGADGKKYNKTYMADEDHTYVCIRFSAKYSGKTKAQAGFEHMKVVYKDDYEFSGAVYQYQLSYLKGDRWVDETVHIFEPLQGEKQFAKVIEVPRELENADLSDIKVVMGQITLNLE